MVGLTYIRVWLRVRSFNDRGLLTQMLSTVVGCSGWGACFTVNDVITFSLPNLYFANVYVACLEVKSPNHHLDCQCYRSSSITTLDTDICDDDFMHKVSWMQCSWYVSPVQRGKEKVSKIAIILIILMYLVIVVCMIVSLAGPLSWLNYLYVLSYIKLAVTVFKYTPQVRRGVTESFMLCAPGASVS